MRKTILGGLASALLLSAGALAPTRAEAQPSDKNLREAELKFKKAQALYQVQEYQNAFDLYKESYLLSLEPALLFNMGQCYRQLKRYEEAIKAYKSYLRDDPKAPKAEIERIIREVEDLLIREKEVGKLPPNGTQDPSKPGGGGTTDTPPPASQKTPPPSTSEPTGADKRSPTARLLYLGAGGAAGLGAVAGTVAFLSGLGVKGLQAEGAASADEITGTFGRARALAISSDALFVIAVGAGAAGFLLQKSYQKQREATLLIGPSGAALNVRY